ncbi:hypothetical protein I302_107105 [Kwoniella bestiolae CBS 10118]|uniref:Myb-like domain-containing protein n=1 Tax=Kwoniella bestiolae CBS 10118 TaxID=1296100 RepID=A0A1B9FZI4_9TREE|nr:hypothetical protein I302_05630 [Kwoniella bestiolae CBS 10118]OCF24171.1 hypothetical protein I302_05630 [Kwoniella bestiolae CBS 10118]
MEGINLGLNAAPPPPESSLSPEPAPKKKRSREEKEARREAKKLKKDKQAKGHEVAVPVQGNDGVFNDSPIVDDTAKEGEKVKKPKESKEEKAKRKAEKFERKARKSEASQAIVNGESLKKKQVSSKMAVPPVEPPTQVKKQPGRSQTTPLKTLSQAGPSTPSPSKRSFLTAKPVRQPSSTPSSSRPRTPKRKSDDKIDDVTLKARLTDQKAVEEWLSSNWVSDIELRRLERIGVLQYKKGKLTEDEKISLRKTLDTYKKVHKLDENQLIDTIMATTTTFPTGRDGWQTFWLDLAAACPGRPGRYVLKMVQRMYNPWGHKGHFTPEEDAMLIQAYDLHPNQWGKIAELVERTYHDCRDRYTKELQHRHTRKTGEWTEEEEKKLVQCIKKMNRSLGRDEMESDGIPWELVVKEMGGTRTVVQCRKKWTDEIYPKVSFGWEKGHERENDYKLISRLEALNYPSEKHINWKEVQDDSLKHLTTHQVRQMYYRLKEKIEGAQNLKFADLMIQLRKTAESLGQISHPKKPSKPEIDSSDEEDEIDGDEKVTTKREAISGDEGEEEQE